MKRKVSLVIPAYNEELNILPMVEKVRQIFSSLPFEYEVIFIDDGSTDNTLNRIKEQAAIHPGIFFIELSRNFGHQFALKAGMDHANGDCLISLDCDLQHPPELIPRMIEKWEEGYDIVYTRRNDDKTAPFIKRKSSKFFYKFLNKISDIEVEAGTADFRLMDIKAVNVFRNFHETDLFVRGLIKWMGFKQFGLDYKPGIRTNGRSKYTFRKMRRLAIQGITSFSTRPLHTAIYLGFFLSFASLFLVYLPYVIYSLVTERAVSGWASLIMTVVFFGGLQLIIMGIIGIYIGKMFMQTKNRPSYIIRDSNMKKSL